MVEPLGIPFVVVVRDELADGATPRALADQDQALEAGVLDGAHEALRGGVQVRRAGGASDGGDIGRGERVAPGRPEEQVAVIDEAPSVSQASVLRKSRDAFVLFFSPLRSASIGTGSSRDGHPTRHCQCRARH